MEPVSPHLPSPSAAWSHLAASYGDLARPDAGSPMMPAAPSAKEEAATLRARLLRMIADSEHSRKATAAEAFNAR